MRRLLHRGMAAMTSKMVRKIKRNDREEHETIFLCIWWMSQVPYAAVFQNRIAAEAAANVRNAILVEISGVRMKIVEVFDWYRRNDADEPMPAEWRDLVTHGYVFGGLVPRRPSA